MNEDTQFLSSKECMQTNPSSFCNINFMPDIFYLLQTGPDGAVVMSLANGLVGTGFASWYRLQPRAGF